uniref:Uncharacterized protein n=1 Tax=Pipistrellus kuhlii TaxID=59472 RepID=A0A7J7VMH9_PIPKU|nr:hypothetical protein mPipKuh1_008384 [Pipistrellus kuhlii]
MFVSHHEDRSNTRASWKTHSTSTTCLPLRGRLRSFPLHLSGLCLLRTSQSCERCPVVLLLAGERRSVHPVFLRGSVWRCQHHVTNSHCPQPAMLARLRVGVPVDRRIAPADGSSLRLLPSSL